MSKRGRPETLDNAKQRTVLTLLSVGCSRRTAAGYVNCDPKTIYNTAQRNPDFADQLARAEHSAQFEHLANLKKAGKELRYWRASAWALERTRPDEFGLRSPESVTPQQLTVLLSRVAEIITEEISVARYRKQVLARLRQILADAEEHPMPERQRNNQQYMNCRERTPRDNQRIQNVPVLRLTLK